MENQLQCRTCGSVEVTAPSLPRAAGGDHRRCLHFTLLLSGLLLLAGASHARAKSLYVIARINTNLGWTPIQAYNIGPDGELIFQTEYEVFTFGTGAVGLALDSQSERLFVTYELSNAIMRLDPLTLRADGRTAAPGAKNLAGIVYDHDKHLLYCMDRGTSTLYAFDWDPINDKLTPVPGSPFTLEGAQAFGLALDEVDDKLYVGGPTAAVRVYSTTDWQLVRTIAVSHVAISVAIDPARGYLYSGGSYPVSDNYYLMQYDLAADKERKTALLPNAGIMGLGVDPATGFIYASTGLNNEGGGDDLLTFDTDLKLLHIVENIGNPTGLVVPDGHISYNPLRLTKTVQTPAGHETTTGKDLPQVLIGAEFTYLLSFDHNDLPLTSVSVVDRLPVEMLFVRATGDGVYGQYDPRAHTYTWFNPPLTGGPTAHLELVCRVDPNTPPGRIIANWATIDSRETPPTTTAVEVVTLGAKGFQPLHVSKTVVAPVAAGAPGAPATAHAGDEVTYRIFFDNKANETPAARVILTDALPQPASFVRATGDGTFGQYDPGTHSYTWSYPSLAPGEGNSVDLVLRLDKNIAPGTTITNVASLQCDNTPTAEATATIRVAGVYEPLTLRKRVIAGTVGRLDDKGRPYIDAGGMVTYDLHFSNPSTNGTVTQVFLVDTLPREASFVSADGDGDFGSYDPSQHSYTWRYAALEPGREGSVSLVVRIDERLVPNSVIANSATITTQEAPLTTTSIEVVTAEVKQHKPLQVSKVVLAPGTAGSPDLPVFADAGSEVTYRISFDNTANKYPVEWVALIDTLPRQASFIRATEKGLYDPRIHTCTWSFPLLAPGESKFVDLVVQLSKDAVGGTTVRNTVTIGSDQTPAQTASADVIVADTTPQKLRKTILGGAVGEPDDQGRVPVLAGGIITYAIHFDTPATDGAATTITIVDTLPREVSFFAADGDRAFGSYDPNTHTYAWRYDVLEARAARSLSLAVRVSERTEPNTVISNVVEIATGRAPPVRAGIDAVVWPSVPPTGIKGQIYVKPDRIWRNNSTADSRLMVIVHLPEGYGEEVIADTPLILKMDVPPALTSANVPATGQTTFGTSTQGKVLCFFDTAPILAATTGYGKFPLKVSGKLRNGQTFVCEGEVSILKFGGP